MGDTSPVKRNKAEERRERIDRAPTSAEVRALVFCDNNVEESHHKTLGDVC